MSYSVPQFQSQHPTHIYPGAYLMGNVHAYGGPTPTYIHWDITQSPDTARAVVNGAPAPPGWFRDESRWYAHPDAPPGQLSPALIPMKIRLETERATVFTTVIPQPDGSMPVGDIIHAVHTLLVHGALRKLYGTYIPDGSPIYQSSHSGQDRTAIPALVYQYATSLVEDRKFFSGLYRDPFDSHGWVLHLTPGPAIPPGPHNNPRLRNNPPPPDNPLPPSNPPPRSSSQGVRMNNSVTIIPISPVARLNRNGRV